MDVIALAIDVGQERQDLEFVRTKALGIGAVESIVKDVREEYVEEFLARALKANALYENKYPLVSAMSRPIIVKHLVEEAHKHQAQATSPTAAPARATTRCASRSASRRSIRTSRSSRPCASGS